MQCNLLKNSIFAAAVFPVCLPGSVMSQNERMALEEVIVSAQRRQQSLQDVPISISAFDSRDINTYRISNLVDLNTLVPNLSAVEGAGGSRSVLFQIRGLYASGTALAADSGVAIYQDGVYLRGGSGSLTNYAELERIEVLRGPQGTLFGRNTSGGAIHFITKDPVGEFGFKQTLTTGNLNLFESRTRVDSPQWGPLSASIDYTMRERDGAVKNSGAGFVADFARQGAGSYTSPERLGDEDTHALLLGVELDLVDNLDLIYKFDYADTKSTPLAAGVLAADPSLAPLIGPSLGTTRPVSVNNAFHLPSNQISQGHNLTVDYAISNTLSFRNILSYRESSIDARGYTLDGLGQFAPVVVIFTATSGQDSEQVSEEMQLIWDTDSYTLTTGFLYYGLDQSAGGYAHTPNAYYGASPPTLTVFPGTDSDLQSTAETASYAVYSQWEYRFNQQWELVLGGRVTNDQKDYIDRTLLSGEVLDVSYDETEPTFLAGVNYQPADNVLLFTKASNGYISGGVVSGLEYQPEKAESLEVGLKADWFDRTLQTNLSVFSVDYQDQQFVTSGNQVEPPVPAAQAIVNAGDTSAKGFELEATWLPYNSLTLGLNLGYLDFKFETLDLDVLGAPPSPHLRPDWTTTLRIDYLSESVLGDVDFRFHFDASYRSEEWAATREVDYTDKEINDSVWRLNAQVSLDGIKIGPGNFSVSVWGRNLTDSDLPANMNVLGPVIAGTYEPPRTYGIDLTYEY